MKRNSLETRLCILTAGLIFAVLIAIGQVQINAEREILMTERTERYQNLSTTLATAYVQLSHAKNRSLYKNLTDKLMRADRSIAYVAIADSAGRTIYLDTNRLSDAERLRLEGKPLQTALHRLRSPLLNFDVQFHQVTMQAIVGPKQRGTINIGLSRGGIDSDLGVIKSRCLAILSLVFVIAILGIVALARTILSPVRQLTRAVKAITAGNLDVSVPVSSNDEIGELAQTFNSMVENLKDNNSRLVLRANTDSLTELYNHRYLRERLDNEIIRATRYRRPLSLIMIDIDHFKVLNDSHGHPFGDAVLQQVSRILLEQSRDIDVVARYGGEEFAIILPETDLSDAAHMAERVRLAIERQCFIENDGTCVPVNISLGVAQYPVNAGDFEGLIMAADLALYQSKADGRNRTTQFNSDMFNNRDADETDPYKLHLLLHADDISTIEAMAVAVDAKSQRRLGFSRSVMQHCLALGKKIGLSDEELNALKVGSLLYDIGKLGISESILTKPAGLTESERTVMRGHPALGYAIVQRSVSLKPILPMILHHHEAWDGTGYPNCLKSQDIPILARVIAVVDSFHAMITDRPFRQSSTVDRAIAELRRCAGTQFDPMIVQAFIEVLEEKVSENQQAA